MAEISRAGSSAVVVVETSHSFIAEGRPDILGKLAHSGEIGLFGGHVEPDQTPYEAVRAELDQELDLRVIGPLQLIECGDFPSQNRRGEEVVRKVSLFHVAIEATTQLTMKVPGTIVHIPKTVEGVEAYKNKVTPFTFRALCRVVNDHLADG